MDDVPRTPLLKSFSVPERVTCSPSRRTSVPSSATRRRAKSPGRCLTETRTAAPISYKGSDGSFFNNDGLNGDHINPYKNGLGKHDMPNKRRKRRSHNVDETRNNRCLIVRMIFFIFSCIKNIVMISLTALFAVLILSLISSWVTERCNDLRNEQFDFNKLKHSFELNVFGQELALDQILTVLDRFHSERGFVEPNVMWCTGWSGSGKSKSMDVLKKVLSDQANVQYILPSFIPQDEEQLNKMAENVLAQMNPCRKNIIIVDGWDDKLDLTIKLLVNIMDKVKLQSSKNPEVKQLLLIISGTKASKHVNQEYLAQRLENKKRNELSVEIFSTILKNSSAYNTLKVIGPITIVPFLPLEMDHVKKCVKKELEHIQRMFKSGVFVVKDKDVFSRVNEDDLINGVLQAITFLPAEFPVLSSTGCKRVLPSLKLLLGDVDAQYNDEL